MFGGDTIFVISPGRERHSDFFSVTVFQSAVLVCGWFMTTFGAGFAILI